MEIRSLAHTSFETLAGAFGAAFAEYEVQLTPKELHTMLRRRGFDPTLSFAAFSGGKIAAFNLNGTGEFAGIPTAYDTGTGTLPEYRGQGLAAQIFEASLPHLRGAGIKQYLLEVLQHNPAAISVYRKLGFEVSREFNYFLAANEDVRSGDFPNENGIIIKPIDPASLGAEVAAFWDFEPSWQNSFEAIRRAPEDFEAMGAFATEADGNGEKLVGYLVTDPSAGDITQIAVEKSHRRQGIGSQLLRQMLKPNRAPAVKCINTEVSCNSITGFLLSTNIALAGKQFEMIKTL